VKTLKLKVDTTTIRMIERDWRLVSVFSNAEKVVSKRVAFWFTKMQIPDIEKLIRALEIGENEINEFQYSFLTNKLMITFLDGHSATFKITQNQHGNSN